eukprot:TRINITY_DN37821_c0_g1_i1.p1 TRINITY_DN37821_c0_g1~~TRINITY_DN37821_c0_g1_i1.p1  ORF type:complete len:233 (-),score=41.95 TRINITY_DN37821_c0_g1_i1:305-1003(-)
MLGTIDQRCPENTGAPVDRGSHYQLRDIFCKEESLTSLSLSVFSYRFFQPIALVRDPRSIDRCYTLALAIMNFEKLFRIVLYVQVGISIMGTIYFQMNVNAFLTFFGFLGLSVGSKLHIKEYIGANGFSLIFDIANWAIWFKKGSRFLPDPYDMDNFHKYYQAIVIMGFVCKLVGIGLAVFVHRQLFDEAEADLPYSANFGAGTTSGASSQQYLNTPPAAATENSSAGYQNM